jgi:hypothetical protein
MPCPYCEVGSAGAELGGDAGLAADSAGGAALGAGFSCCGGVCVRTGRGTKWSMVMCAGTAGAARSDCGGSRWRLHSLRTSTRSFCTPPVSLAFLPSLSLSTTPAKVRATLYSSRPLRRMASPMRIRGGSVVGTGRAAMVVPSPKADLTAALIAAGDASFERLRLLERLLVVRAVDLLAALAGDAAGADAFRFLGMGVNVVAAGRPVEISAGVRCC